LRRECQLLSEDIMKESVIYQDILQKGEKNEAFRLVSRQLNRRFGDIDSSTIERIRVLSTTQLEVLAEELLDFSDTSDLETWLNQDS
jgi:predicted transposase YdaD